MSETVGITGSFEKLEKTRFALDVSSSGQLWFCRRVLASLTQIHMRTREIGRILNFFSKYSVLSPRPDKCSKSERENCATSFLFL